MSRNNHWRCSIKTSVLKYFAIFIGKKRELESLFDKFVPTQVFSCKYCEIFKDIYFEEDLQTAASECRLQQQ